MYKIAIIGTGLIGTSLGLAIKAAMSKGVLVVGVDSDRGRANKAQKLGALDKAEGEIYKAVEDAQMVILATPVMTMQRALQEISPYLKEGCLVTDTGSTKQTVMNWAQELLPEEVDFIGGHPMAGKETSGPDHADATLFQGRTYCLIPAQHTHQESIKAMTGLVQAIGAYHYFIDPVEHDSFVAAASHLPLILSVALVRCTASSPSWSDIAKVASTGYRDITRLASGDPIMHRDICATNGEPILAWIDTFIRELSSIRQDILEASSGDPASLQQVFTEALRQREAWLEGRVTTPDQQRLPGSETPSFMQNVAQLFLGNKVLEAHKRFTRGPRWEEREG